MQQPYDALKTKACGLLRRQYHYCQIENFKRLDSFYPQPPTLTTLIPKDFHHRDDPFFHSPEFSWSAKPLPRFHHQTGAHN